MILRQLCEAYAAAPDGKARLDCGCLARPSCFVPCAWHRREFVEELRRSMEEADECHEACCDPG